MSDLTIIDMDKPMKINKKIALLPKELPTVPFRWSIIGASYSGKTTMLCNLFRKKFYGKFWKRNHIFVFSPTVALDDKLKECIPSNQFYDKFEPEVLEEIYTEQQSIKNMYGKKKLDHILVILDDCLGSGCFNRNSVISKFIHKTRHYNVSMIYSVQLFKGLGTNIRSNSDVISIFRCTNFGEIDKILEETSDKHSRKKMREILVQIFTKPYNFLHIDYQDKNLNHRYREGFTKHIDNPFLE